MPQRKRSSDKPVGVIVARFHVPMLHKGHMFTVDLVAKQHTDVLIILGCAPVQSDRNPLTFEMRKQMVRQAFPGRRFKFASINSSPAPAEVRSARVDEVIGDTFPGRRAIIYGARDSIVHNYVGSFETQLVPTVFLGSATHIRSTLNVRHTPDFRAGVIHTLVNRKPISFAAADVAVVDIKKRRLLLVAKKDEGGKYRFPGVFLNEQDASFESAASRCLSKELPRIVTGPLEMIGSRRIKDWRYSRTRDGIVSVLFLTEYVKGEIVPGQGVDGASWVSILAIPRSMVESHLPLFELLPGQWKP